MIHVEQAFRQLEHVVGVARFRPFALFHVLLVVIERREMFRNAVAANRDTALVHDTVPEVLGALHVSLVAGEFRNAREAHHLRDLRIRMHIREVIIARCHRIQKPLVRPTLGLVQVLLFLGHRIGISIDFRHAAVFRAEHRFHLGIVQPARNRESPITKREEHRFGLIVTRIDVGIAQARIKFVDVVPRHPIAVLRTRIAVLEFEPHRLAVGHAADIALEIRILGILVLNRLEFAQHVFQAFLDEFIATGRIMHGKRTQVMTQHVPVKPSPVRELRGLRPHSCFFVERRY